MMDCQRCHANSQLWLCHRCTKRLRTLLVDLAIGPKNGHHHSAGLLEYLADSATGQTRHTDPGIRATHAGASTSTPAANPSAANLLASIHAQMMCIAASLRRTDAITHGRATLVDPAFIGPLRPNERRLPASTYQPTSQELAIWLAGHVDAIAHQRTAGATMRTIEGATHRAMRIIDTHPPRHPAGICDCGQTLRAAPDAKYVTCKRCGIRHEVEILHADQIRRAITAGAAFTADEFPVAMAIIGTPVSARTFRHWRATGKLPNVAPAGDTPRYRPTDLPRFRTGVLA